MNRWSAGSLIVVVLVGLGCATSYQPDTGRGGYSERQLEADLYRVEFRGNRYTSKARSHDLLMKRCAELALAAGYDGFMVVVAADARTAEEVRLSEHYQRVTGTEIEQTNKCRRGAVVTDTQRIREQTAVVKVPLSVATVRLVRAEAARAEEEYVDAARVLAERP